MSNITFHLSELFWRIFYPLLFSFFSFFLFGFYFKEIIYFIVCNKAQISFLILTNPLEGIYSYLSLATFLAIILIGLPILIINLYLYIRPSLIFNSSSSYFNEFLVIFLFISLPLISVLLSLKILPYAINILISPIFGNKEFNIMFIYWVPQISSIISLFITLTISSLIYILIPIFIIFIQIKLGNPRKKAIWKAIIKYRQITIWIILTFIAIITPPDLITLIITGIPIILILEISFYMTLIVLKYSVGDSSRSNLHEST